MPEVSIIIPTCNRPQFLRGAIASALEQTFQDFEIVVVDDSPRPRSPDRESEVSLAVRSFNDPRIRLICHEANRGGSAARNTGIVNSSGRYIAFLDDDDEWLPEKLASQVHLLHWSPKIVGCVYTGYYVVNRADRAITAQRRPTESGDLSQELLTTNCLGGTSSVLLRRECLQTVGMFDEALPSFQDYDLWLRLSRAYHFDCIQTPLLRYYVHPVKIWTNLDVLRQGMDLMLRKHGASKMLRKHWSYRYLSLGVCYCCEGELGKGRNTILQGVRLNPLELRHYFNLGISLLGTDSFRKLKGFPPEPAKQENVGCSLQAEDQV